MAGNLLFIRSSGKMFPAPVFPPSVNHPQPCVDHKPAQSRRGHIDHVSPENPHSQGDLVENDLLGGIVGGKVEHGDVGFRAGSPVDGQSREAAAEKQGKTGEKSRRFPQGETGERAGGPDEDQCKVPEKAVKGQGDIGVHQPAGLRQGQKAP